MRSCWAASEAVEEGRRTSRPQQRGLGQLDRSRCTTTFFTLAEGCPTAALSKHESTRPFDRLIPTPRQFWSNFYRHRSNRGHCGRSPTGSLFTPDGPLAARSATTIRIGGASQPGVGAAPVPRTSSRRDLRRHTRLAATAGTSVKSPLIRGSASRCDVPREQVNERGAVLSRSVSPSRHRQSSTTVGT